MITRTTLITITRTITRMITRTPLSQLTLIRTGRFTPTARLLPRARRGPVPNSRATRGRASSCFSIRRAASPAT